MKRVFFILLSLVFASQLFAQSHFYVMPNAGVVWSHYHNSNPDIYGNKPHALLFSRFKTDNIGGLLLGYQFDNNLIVETGLNFHFAENRYNFENPELSDWGGSVFGLDDTYFLIPVNVKYGISTPVEGLKVIPYAGITLSTHTQEVGVFGTMYNEVYDPESAFPNLIVTDTSSIIRIGRPSNNNVLLNAGANIEYKVLNWLVVSLSGNFTFGFTDLNRIEVEVLKPEGTEYGEIAYRGNKFYMAAGLKVPFGL